MQAVFRNRRMPYLLLLPTLIILVLFLYYPIISTFNLSFYQSAPNGIDLTFLGFANYTRLLDPQLQRMAAGTLLVKNSYILVVVRSLLFSASIVVGGLSLSLGVAMLANQKVRGIRIYRTLLDLALRDFPRDYRRNLPVHVQSGRRGDQLRLGRDFSHPSQLAGRSFARARRW